MTNMSLLDELIGSINHIVMDFKHDGGGGNMMTETVIVLLHNFLECALEKKLNELVVTIGSVKLRGSGNLYLIKRCEDELEYGI